MTEQSQNIEDIIGRLSSRHDAVLALALKRAQERLQEDPTEQNIRAAQTAKKALDEYFNQFKEQKAPVLPNRIKITEHLQRQGYKIKRQKVYDDAKRGILKLAADGSCTEEEADRYAGRAGLKKFAEINAGAAERLAHERAAAELALVNKKIEEKTFELEKARGQYLPRDQFEQELSARMAVLKHGLSHLAQSRANELLEWGKSNGPQAMADEMEAAFEGLLNDYANRETFQVFVMPESYATSA